MLQIRRRKSEWQHPSKPKIDKEIALASGKNDRKINTTVKYYCEVINTVV